MEDEITREVFIKKLLQALNDCGVHYMVIGGIAAVYYGRQRSTNDCDVALSLKPETIKDFCACLKKNGFKVGEHDVLMAFKEKSHFNAYLGDYIFFRADFSWIESSSLSRLGFENAQDSLLFGVRAKIERPEDVIVAKLVYGSPQDIDDALAILLRQKRLNKEYLLKRADEEGVIKALEALLAQC